ncbi:MAG: DNA-processing protein DprA [Candidatus Moranbacteria bacterium]|nr:DNA-processing protein DprA [Candidatus Moranbacteria bacterium]
MTQQEKIYLNAFNTLSGIGGQKLRMINSHFESFKQAWQSEAKEFQKAGLPEKLSHSIIEQKEKIKPEEEWKKLEKHEIKIVTIDEENYPPLLKEIDSPPFLLYVRGNLDALLMPAVSVVGSRKYSAYGKQCCIKLSFDIAKAGIAVVSGLALGIDAIAQAAALKAKGTTISVLGGSIDESSISPRNNVALANHILENGGALISEYPVPTIPNKGTFPARNRIMAGLVKATLAIEAAPKSGTLITADLAKKFERKIFAVPGSIFSDQSIGTHTLIKNGDAQLVGKAEDILEIFNISKNEVVKNINEILPKNPDEKMVFELIKNSGGGMNINEIIRDAKLEAMTVSSILIEMELNGIIKNIGNQVYIVI